MKKDTLKFILLIFLIINFISCIPYDDDPITADKLPQLARSFINTNLQDYQILNIEELSKESEALEKYRITFSNDLTIVFNFLGYWWLVDSKTPMNEKLLEIIDANQLEAFHKQYPEAKVTGIYNNKKNRRIKLSDNTLLAFYYSNEKVFIGEDISSKIGEYPPKLNDFFNKYLPNFKNQSIIYANESGKDIYKVEVTTAENIEVTINFDKGMNWTFFDSYPYAIPDNLYQSLPQVVKDFHKNRYPNSKVYNIIRYDAYYQLNLGNNLSILIDPDTGEFIYPNIAVFEFVRKHFSKNTTYNLSAYLNRNPDLISYLYEVKIDDYFIKMTTDKNGNWIELLVNKPIPESVIYELHWKIIEKIKKIQPVFYITHILIEGDRYKIKVNNYYLYFDNEGDLITN